uniref:Uncharacterized protein n=1 Tax=Apteryx owenii TaxID=8824 RepID=A0A8B9SG04_APTOW
VQTTTSSFQSKSFWTFCGVSSRFTLLRSSDRTRSQWAVSGSRITFTVGERESTSQGKNCIIHCLLHLSGVKVSIYFISLYCIRFSVLKTEVLFNKTLFFSVFCSNTMGLSNDPPGLAITNGNLASMQENRSKTSA